MARPEDADEAASPRMSRPREAPTREEPTASGVIPLPQETAALPSFVVRVETNVPSATISLQALRFGGEPDPALQTKSAASSGVAEFHVPVDPRELAGIRATARAESYCEESVVVDHDQSDITLNLRHGLPVTGYVISNEGMPIEGATVSATAGTTRLSGSDGSFSVCATAVGAYLDVTKSGYLPFRTVVETLPSFASVTLNSGLDVKGRVTFPSGAPVQGMSIRADRGDSQAITDEEGRYRLSGLVPGPIGVWCEADRSDVRQVSAGESGVDFTVNDHWYRIHFVDTQGRPFRRGEYFIEVWNDGEKERQTQGGTGTAGTTFVSVPTGRLLKICVTASDRVSAITRAAVEGSATAHDVTVTVGSKVEQGSVVLRVVSPVATRPSLILRNEMGLAVARLGKTPAVHVLENGAYRVDDLPPGDYNVQLSPSEPYAAEDFSLSTVADVVIVSGHTITHEIRMEVGGRLLVNVYGRNGEPRAPGRLRLLNAQGVEVVTTFGSKTASGWVSPPSKVGPAYLALPVPGGSYTVQAVQDGLVLGSAGVVIVAGATAQADIVIER